MVDEELRQLIEGSAAETRRYVDASAAETRLEFRTAHESLETRFSGLETRFSGLEDRFSGLETRFSGLETRFSGLEGRFDSTVEEIKAHFDEKVRDLDALFGAANEEMRQRVELVAEAVAVVDEKVDRRTAELEHKIDDAVDVFKTAYAALEKRVTVLEQGSIRS